MNRTLTLPTPPVDADIRWTSAGRAGAGLTGAKPAPAGFSRVDWAAVDWAAVDWAAVDWAGVSWAGVDGAGVDWSTLPTVDKSAPVQPIGRIPVTVHAITEPHPGPQWKALFE